MISAVLHLVRRLAEARERGASPSQRLCELGACGHSAPAPERIPLRLPWSLQGRTEPVLYWPSLDLWADVPPGIDPGPGGGRLEAAPQAQGADR